MTFEAGTTLVYSLKAVSTSKLEALVRGEVGDGTVWEFISYAITKNALTLGASLLMSKKP
jgi:hypothetical protein